MKNRESVANISSELEIQFVGIEGLVLGIRNWALQIRHLGLVLKI